eukprot:PhM_4_TR13315/c0_g1_i1/m.20950
MTSVLTNPQATPFSPADGASPAPRYHDEHQYLTRQSNQTSASSSQSMGMSKSQSPEATGMSSSAYTLRVLGNTSQQPHRSRSTSPHDTMSVVYPATVAQPSFRPDPTCDKCSKVVPGGDFKTHNKFCLGKLCNRCHSTVHGSYEDHKMVCQTRKCDRCGLIPTESFTEHNRLCKAATMARN